MKKQWFHGKVDLSLWTPDSSLFENFEKWFIDELEFAFRYVLNDEGGWNFDFSFFCTDGYEESAAADPLDINIGFPCLNDDDPPSFRFNLNQCVEYMKEHLDPDNGDDEMPDKYAAIAGALRGLADRIDQAIEQAHVKQPDKQKPQTTSD